MSLRNSNPGIHFKDPWLMSPITVAASGLGIAQSTGGAFLASTTTSFFTGFAKWGVQDGTDWSANTFKTIYSHTGSGIVYAMVACTAGGAETTTFEITIDGVLKTITVTSASGERAALMAANTSDASADEFTTATNYATPNGALDSGTLTTFQTVGQNVIPMKFYGNVGIPALRYDISCLIRMKHSTSITNSTATAYSAVMVRKGIAS